MIYQVAIDKDRYVTVASEGGKIPGGIDLPEEVFHSADMEKISACRLSEDEGKLVFDSERWAETENIRRMEGLRVRRAQECFPVVNRGALWYDTLTAGQYEELESWYRRWLDAPQTGEAPGAPCFLREEKL